MDSDSGLEIRTARPAAETPERSSSLDRDFVHVPQPVLDGGRGDR